MNTKEYIEGSIIVTFLKGFDEQNNPMYEKRTFKNVKEDATVASLKDVAGLFGNLLGFQVEKVEHVTRYAI